MSSLSHNDLRFLAVQVSILHIVQLNINSGTWGIILGCVGHRDTKESDFGQIITESYSIYQMYLFVQEKNIC